MGINNITFNNKADFDLISAIFNKVSDIVFFHLRTELAKGSFCVSAVFFLLEYVSENIDQHGNLLDELNQAIQTVQDVGDLYANLLIISEKYEFTDDIKCSYTELNNKCVEIIRESEGNNDPRSVLAGIYLRCFIQSYNSYSKALDFQK